MNALKALLIGALAFLGVQGAMAQAPWPTKPIRVIVPYGAGGGADNLARALGEVAGKELKQPFVIENRPGASGMLGGAACKNAAPDGYTFCLSLVDMVAINPAIFKKAAYKASDFLPIAHAGDVVGIIAVPATLPINSIRDLVAYAKANPAGTNWASWGIGSSSHLLLELINKRFDAGITHVPYQTTPAMVTAVLTAEATGTFAPYAQLKQHIDTGKMRVIAIVGDSRLRQLPDVATLREQGADFKSGSWFGVFAPAATPAPIATRMHDALNRAVVDPAVTKMFEAMAINANPMSQAAFAELLRRDTEAWRAIAQQANVSLD